MAKVFRIVGRRKPALALGAAYPKVTRENALDLSIAKWQAIVDYYVKHEQDSERRLLSEYDTCALCLLYTPPFSCLGCPVQARTGTFQCHNTPYWDHRNAMTPAQALRAARRELAFLQSLKT